MQGYNFSWRDHRYRADSATLAVWPIAKLIAGGDLPEILLCTSDALFCQAAARLCARDETQRIDPYSIPESLRLLDEQGFSVLSIGGALCFVRDYPETIQVEHVMSCLSRWYFVARVLPF
ncbi:MAG: hypothetical protein AB8B81_17910 [Halioglobus sp.]